MDINSIVVGTDFSPESNSAVQHALNVARLTDAKINLIHSCPMVEPPSGTVSTQWTALMRAQLSHNRQQLETLRESISGQGPEISHMVIDELPDAGIIDSASELGAQLIVVGTRGLTGVKHFLLGSVAERVVRRSKCSVLVARAAEHLAGGYRRILVPTDFSATAEFALQFAASLVAADGRIDLCQWWHSPNGGGLPDPQYLRQHLQETSLQAGTALVERYRGANYTIEFETAEAPPKVGIQSYLSSGNHDLVVMGSHGRRGIARWLIGSVAEATVRHAPCSVLIARPPQSEQ